MKFHKNVQVREEKFGTVIFETLKEKVFVTNQTGADIVRLLQEKQTKDEVINELAHLYNTKQSAIEGEVNSFMDNLVKQNILCS